MLVDVGQGFRDGLNFQVGCVCYLKLVQVVVVVGSRLVQFMFVLWNEKVEVGKEW